MKAPLFIQSLKERLSMEEIMPKVHTPILCHFFLMQTPRTEMLIEKAKEGYDIVVASLYIPSAKSNDDGLITGFRNWIFRRTANLLHVVE